MYNRRFMKWNVFKSLGRHDVREFLQQPVSGKDGNSEDIVLRGRRVRKSRLVKYFKRRADTAPVEVIDLYKLDSEAPDAETAPIGVIDLEKLDSEESDAFSLYLTLLGLEPYKDLETLGTGGTEDKLTSEELTSLHIAMLQTDFHYRGSDNDAAPGFQDEKVQIQSGEPGASTSAKYVPSQSLSGPQELRDLEFVLYNSNEYYGYFPGVRQNSSNDSFMLSSRQQGQAKDFYARHWLAISLLSKSSQMAAWK